MAGKHEKSRGQPNAISRFVRETVGELRKVSWPSRQEATNLTAIVLVVMVLMSLFLWLVDLGGTALLDLVIPK
ncbi:preprotein translocase subunit SecE [bacterium]|nr:preprotein translocase subunit SecE [bacterium]OIO87645.1 MAG: preprotein translocase subunit SecE [Anaerolineae bacterium CG2_30_58_95]